LEVLVSEYTDFLRRENKLSGNTIKSYETDLKCYANYLSEHRINCLSVNPKIINRYIACMKRNKLSTSTISRRISSLKAFYKYLKIRNIISETPMNDIQSVKKHRVKREVASRELIEFIINMPNTDDVTGLRDKAVFEIIYGAGMRISELINLKISDIDFELNCITCGSDSHRRTVPMYKRLADTISDYIKYERPRLLKNEESEFLLINKNGGAFSRQGIYKLVRRYTERIPIGKDITPDKLRQALAVHLLECGVAKSNIQSFMGYKDLYSLNGYIGSVPKRKRYVLKLKNKRKLTDVHPRGKLIYNAQLQNG